MRITFKALFDNKMCYIESQIGKNREYDNNGDVLDDRTLALARIRFCAADRRDVCTDVCQPLVWGSRYYRCRPLMVNTYPCLRPNHYLVGAFGYLFSSVV